MARTDGYGKTSRLILAAALIVLIFAVKEAEEILVPVAVAVLLSFLLTPLITRLERWHFRRVPAVIVVVILAFSIIGGCGWLVGQQFGEFARKLPSYQHNIETKIQSFRNLSGGTFERLTTAIHGVASEINNATPTTNAAPTTTTAPTPNIAPGATHQSSGPAAALAAATQPFEPVPVRIVGSEAGFTTILQTLGPVFRVGAAVFIITVLVIFMAIGREDLRDRFIRLVSHGQINLTTQALDDAASRISRYLLMQSLVNGSYGVLVGLGLWRIGVPDAALWGLLAGLLRFIPYVGSWLGASMPLLLSLAVFPGFGHLLMTVGLFVAIELTTNSVIEPHLYGTNTGVSSIAILVSAIFWAWVWGPIGLLLATPLTVCLVVMGKYVPHLEFLNIMLGDEPVFKPKMRFYQRLLASDTEEATDIVEEAVQRSSLEQAYEHIVLPALTMADEGLRRGRLDEEKNQFIRQSVRDLIEEMEDRAPPEPREEPPGTAQGAAPSRAGTWRTHAAGWLKRAFGVKKFAPPAGTEAAMQQLLSPRPPRPQVADAENVRILCLPARDENDELAGDMLAQLLQARGFRAESVSVSSLASEMIDLVGTKNADVVVISALPPSAVAHSRYLCKRLHARFPQTHLFVGLWNTGGDLSRAHARITCAGTDKVTASFNDVIVQIEQLAHVLLLQHRPPHDPTSSIADAPVAEGAG